jgi:hypothetical protein
MRRSTLLPRAGLAVLVAAGCQAAAAEPPVDFDRDVRPFLSTHCNACHDGVKKAGGISFLARETAAAEGDLGRQAVDPGSPDSSEMLRRLTSTDEDERMPPAAHRGRSRRSATLDCRGRRVAAKDGISAVGAAVLPLPIAGLMSDLPGAEVAARYAALDGFAKRLGSGLSHPFMTLSFMALLVIPALKLGPQGLFDVDRFAPVSLFDTSPPG